MIKLSFRILLLILVTVTSVQAEEIILDTNNFIICYSNDQNAFYFDWDKFISTPTKQVYYLPLKKCSDAKHLQDIPQENLHNLSEIQSILPEQVLFSIHQIENGAHVYRNEKTASEYIANRPDLFKSDSPEVLTKLRFETGDSFSQEVISTWLNDLNLKNKSCENLIGTCDFYLCQEAKNPCGLDGYNLSYGYKYCSDSKFNLLNKMKSEAGKVWTTNVFQCLQKQSLLFSTNTNAENISCENIKQTAYKSHPDCYVEAGFCKLSAVDKFKIFKTIKKEIFSSAAVTQGLKVLNQCSEK